MKRLKVALVHDYLREYGGAERVLEALHEMFPEAPLYTAFVDSDALGIHWNRFKDWDIKESSAAKIPFIHANKVYSPLRLLSSYFFEGFDFSGYDVVISSTNMYMAKAVLTGPQTLHVSYIHTPSRSLYGYTTRTDWKSRPLTRVIGELINFRMRTIDYLTAQRPDVLVANSHEVQNRIKNFYRRDSTVIYPPVSLPAVANGHKKEEREYYLYVGRITRSKHIDLAIQSCVQLGYQLKVVGVGKGEEYLKTLANEKVEFLQSVSDEKIAELYSGAKGILFPSEDEDFGIVPVEAMLHGVPVIAHNSGGPKETIIDGKTGVLFDELTTDGLIQAIERFETLSFDADKIKTHAQKFSKERFQKQIMDLIEKEYTKL
jgi:glycosyltransferase involved in cell wall biosynthesis